MGFKTLSRARGKDFLYLKTEAESFNRSKGDQQQIQNTLNGFRLEPTLPQRRVLAAASPTVQLLLVPAEVTMSPGTAATTSPCVGGDPCSGATAIPGSADRLAQAETSPGVPAVPS